MVNGNNFLASLKLNNCHIIYCPSELLMQGRRSCKSLLQRMHCVHGRTMDLFCNVDNGNPLVPRVEKIKIRN